jgi:hypothetical protein
MRIRAAAGAFLVALIWSTGSPGALAQETGGQLSAPQPTAPAPASASGEQPPADAKRPDEDASGREAPQAEDESEVPPAPSNSGGSEDYGTVPPPPHEPEEGDRYTDSSQKGYPHSGPQGDGIRIPSRIATRLRVLDADLNALGSRGGNNIVDGVLSLLSGSLSITLGVLVDDNRMSNYLYLWGSANAARGILDLALAPDASEPAITFGHMPMGSMEEVRQRLHYGENELESLATKSRLMRILDASINIGVGVSVIPIYLAPNDFEVKDPLDYFVIIGSGISVISGVINLVAKSEAEKRWEAYESLRDRLKKENEQDGQSAETDRESLQAVSQEESGFRAQFDIAPARGGAVGVLRARF